MAPVGSWVTRVAVLRALQRSASRGWRSAHHLGLARHQGQRAARTTYSTGTAACLQDPAAQTQSPLGCAARCVIGKRRTNEDRFVTATLASSPDCHLFAVFDGHSGDQASAYLAEHLAGLVDQELAGQLAAGAGVADADYGAILRGACQSAALGFREHVSSLEAGEYDEALIARVGSTAYVALVTPHLLALGSIGDSRGVISTAEGEPEQPLMEHRPDRSDEARRIMAAGGKITFRGVPRVNGILAMTRAVGAHHLADVGVTSEPEVAIRPRTAADQFLLVATDGVFDFLPNREALQLATVEGSPQEAVDSVVFHAEAYGSRDNLTAVLVPLDAWHERRLPATVELRQLPRNLTKASG